MDGVTALTLLILVLGLAIAGFYITRKRSRAIRTVAPQIGFRPLDISTPKYQRYRQSLSHWFSGRSVTLSNEIWGDRGPCQMMLCDCAYRLTSGKRLQHQSQTLVLIDNPNLHLPEFSLMPRTPFHQLLHPDVGTSIPLPTAPAFTQRYRLSGDRPTEVQQLWTADALALLQARPGVTVGGSGELMVYYYAQRLCPPQQWPDLLQEAIALYNAIAFYK